MSAPFLLILLAFSVFYFIWYQSYSNGLLKLADTLVLAKKLPGWNEPLLTEYLGIAPIDRLLTGLTTFFYPVGDLQSPGLFLHSLAFSGAFGAAWAMITLESWRAGTARTAAAFPSVLGVAAQTMSLAFATPLYGYLHLTRSLTARTPTVGNMRVPQGVVNAMPLIFTVAMQVPSIAMALPFSKHMTHERKQIAIAIWQPWPLYVHTLLVIAHYTVGRFFGDMDSPSNNRKIRSSLRYVYAFAFAGAALPHLILVTLSAVTLVAPNVFHAEYVEAWNPRSLFALSLPWTVPAHKVTTVAQGVQIFLKWDFAITSAAFLIWSLSLYRSAHVAAKVKIDVLGLANKMARLLLVSGPIGTGVELLWEREELFLPDVDKRVVVASNKKRH